MFTELIKELTNIEVFFSSLQAMKDNFSVNTVIMCIMMIFCIVGGVDKIRGNKHGYGERFDEAFATLKPLALSMIGVITLAPVLKLVLEPIISPVYELFGASPAMFAGTFFAVDAGAYPLAMVLSGAFPMVLWISRTFRKPIMKLAEKLGMNEAGGTALIATLANYFPTLDLVKEMNLKGRFLVFTFAMSGAFIFGDHLGFIAGVDSEMVLPMIVAKIVAGVTALLLANVLAPKLLRGYEEQ